MRKTLMMLAVFFTVVFGLGALDNLHFTVRGAEYAAGINAQFSVSHLQMRETVYQGASSGDLLSEIEWDMGIQAAAGTGFFIAPENPFARTGLSFEGMFLWRFPVNNRIMTDTDWDDEGTISAYGESPVSVLAGMEAAGIAAVGFPIRNQYLIEAFAELWYGRYAAAAHDGWTGQYDDSRQIPLYGTAVEYIQEWIVCAPGIGFRSRLKNGHIGVRLSFSPFVYGYHIDNHYFRKLEDDDPDQKYMSYTDSVRGGVYAAVRGDWIWRITPYVQMGIAAQYRAVEGARGDTTINTAGLAGYSFKDAGTAGASIRTIALDITIRTLL